MKEEVEKFSCLTFFVALKFTKLKIIFEQVKKNNLNQFLLSSQKYNWGTGIRDPEKNFS
jgi:hypothetical protein